MKNVHPRHPDAEYDPSISDKNTAGFSDENGEQYYVKREQLPSGHPARTKDSVKKDSTMDRAAYHKALDKIMDGKKTKDGGDPAKQAALQTIEKIRAMPREQQKEYQDLLTAALNKVNSKDGALGNAWGAVKSAASKVNSRVQKAV